MSRSTMIWIAALVLAAIAGYVVRGVPFLQLLQRQTTLKSLSPNDKWRVSLIERPAFLDRNFDLQLERIGSGETRIVFESPDEGEPIGSERIVWSVDGSLFLLVGRHFYTPESAVLANGEQAYLLMNVETGELWCNAKQQSEFPAFDVSSIQTTRWFGWTPTPAKSIDPSPAD